LQVQPSDSWNGFNDPIAQRFYLYERNFDRISAPRSYVFIVNRDYNLSNIFTRNEIQFDEHVHI